MTMLIWCLLQKIDILSMLLHWTDRQSYECESIIFDFVN